jgi:hypothetical protein
MHPIVSYCPKCGHQVFGAFPSQCPNCPFNIAALAGKGTTAFQISKIIKHTDLLQGRNIRLSKNDTYNASFDYNGYAQLDDIVILFDS